MLHLISNKQGGEEWRSHGQKQAFHSGTRPEAQGARGHICSDTFSGQWGRQWRGSSSGRQWCRLLCQHISSGVLSDGWLLTCPQGCCPSETWLVPQQTGGKASSVLLPKPGLLPDWSLKLHQAKEKDKVCSGPKPEWNSSRSIRVRYQTPWNGILALPQ